MSKNDTTNHTVGIDLGTTRTAVAHISGEQPRLIGNEGGSELTPSVVHMTEEGTAIVGNEAVDKMVLKPERTIAEIKRKMGEKTNVHLGSKSYRPEGISSLILEKVLNDATGSLDASINGAVITVPAYFTGRQRTATRNAGEIAGVEVEQLLPEPSAAVLAYGYERQQLGETANETVFVYDLGGGTFDATLVEAEYEHNYVETILTDGDSDLGGSDWTAAIEDWIIDGIRNETGREIGSSTEFADQRARIRAAAREAKHELTHKQEIIVNIPFVIPEQSYSFERRLDQKTFNELTNELLERTTRTIDTIFADSEYDRSDIDTVLLIGGASRMPQVEEMLERYFGQSPNKQVNPDKAVAIGAAIQASILSSDATETGTLLSDKNDKNSSAGGVVLIDVLPQTLGVGLVNDRFSPIAEKGTQLPTTVREETYRTVNPSQTEIKWPILQGQSPKASENDLLGTVWIRDIPPRDPDEDSIAIEFTMNSDGTLEVEVEDMLTGKIVDSTIESGIRLSQNEIDQMGKKLPNVE